MRAGFTPEALLGGCAAFAGGLGGVVPDGGACSFPEPSGAADEGFADGFDSPG